MDLNVKLSYPLYMFMIIIVNNTICCRKIVPMSIAGREINFKTSYKI